jgi:hypothetical protein
VDATCFRSFPLPKGPALRRVISSSTLPGSSASTPMRAVFVIYVVLIAAGLVTFTIIGLTHH